VVKTIYAVKGVSYEKWLWQVGDRLHVPSALSLGQLRCRAETPPLVEVRPNHTVACHFWGEIEGRPASFNKP